jgi:transposase-like protein
MLDAELTEHLGYNKYSPTGRNIGNSRNCKTPKTLKNDNGEIDITVPRDRNGSFDPIIVKKYERTLGPIEEMDKSSPKLDIGNITFISYF